MSEWGLLPTEYTQEEIEHLALAYLRRKRFEARLIAVEVGALFTGSQRQQEQFTDDQAWELLNSTS